MSPPRALSRRALLSGALPARQRPRPPGGPGMLPPGADGSPPLVAHAVTRVPESPEDPAWLRSTVHPVSLNPQNLVVPRVRAIDVEALWVAALYDRERVAFRLDWWPDAGRDESLARLGASRDAVALQFPSDGRAPAPNFCMGAQGSPVTIYQWKADWQLGALHDVDEAFPGMVTDGYPFSGKGTGEMAESVDYLRAGAGEFVTALAAGSLLADPELQARTPVERLTAQGFGTLESEARQDGAGHGIRVSDGWQVVIVIPRRQPGFTMEAGGRYPVAFAQWDGSRDQRNGQKGYSDWHSLELAPPGGLEGWLRDPARRTLGGAVVVILGVLAALLGRRRRKGG